MEYMFDTANIKTIKELSEIYPITGVTSNPSIVKKEGKISLPSFSNVAFKWDSFASHLRSVQWIQN